MNGLAAFTLFHVAISLVGIFAGLIVAVGLLTAKRLDGWTAIFLVFTVATSVTGFMFPFHGFKPSYVVGAISLLILLAAIVARYSRRMAGAWRWIYVVTAMIALYLNVFVLIVQSFMKVPGAESVGANPDGTAVQANPTCRAGDLRRPYGGCEHQVPD